MKAFMLDKLVLVLLSLYSSNVLASQYGRGARVVATAYDQYNRYQGQNLSSPLIENYDYRDLPMEEVRGYDDYQGQGQYHAPQGLWGTVRSALNVNAYQNLQPEYDEYSNEYYRAPRFVEPAYGNAAVPYHQPYQEPIYNQAVVPYHQPSQEQQYSQQQSHDGYNGGYDNNVSYDNSYSQGGSMYHVPEHHDQQSNFFPQNDQNWDYYQQPEASRYLPPVSDNWQISTYPRQEVEAWPGPEYDPNLYPREGTEDDDPYWQAWGQAKYELPNDYHERWLRENPEIQHEDEWYRARQDDRTPTIQGATYVLYEDDPANDGYDPYFPVDGGIVEVVQSDGVRRAVTILPPQPDGPISHDFECENPISWWKYMCSKEERKRVVRECQELLGCKKSLFGFWKRRYIKNKVMVLMVQSDALQFLNKHGYTSTPRQRRAIAYGLYRKSKKDKRPILEVPPSNLGWTPPGQASK